MASPLARVVGAALEAARRALRNLDADQVPADLRRVAAHAGALTPPLAATLLRALDRYDWLRDKAVEAWEEADPDSPNRDVALGTLFLARPPGWTERIAAAVSDASLAGVAEGDRRRAAAIAELERAAADAKRRLREERERAIREREEFAGQLESARAAARAVRGGEARGRATALRRAEEAEDRAAATAERLDRVEKELASVREALALERRRRTAAEHAQAEAEAGGRGWLAGDPEALAAHLDDVALMARPVAAEARPGVTAPGSSAVRLPGGVAPDSAEAVDWLLSRTAPTTVIVDGYNAGFALAGPGDPSAARRRLQVVVDRLPTLAGGPMQLTVVYDSSIDGDLVSTGRVTVRFAPPEGSADEEIVALAERTPGPVVVISGDRSVREGAEAAGALALWSSALAGWATRR